MANACVCLGDYDRAEALFADALSIRPHRAALHSDIGQFRLLRGDLLGALPYLKTARVFEPDRVSIAEALGLAYVHARLADSAFSLADTLLKANPKEPSGYLIRLVANVSIADSAAARDDLAKYLEYGRGRSDIDQVVRGFGYLLQSLTNSHN